MGGGDMAGNRIELSELLRYVSTELQKADTAARADDSAVMAFDQCTLELAVTAERQADAGIKVWILNLGAGAKKSDSHTITITMKALTDRTVVAPGQAGEIPVDKKHTRQTARR